MVASRQRRRAGSRVRAPWMIWQCCADASQLWWLPGRRVSDRRVAALCNQACIATRKPRQEEWQPLSGMHDELLVSQGNVRFCNQAELRLLEIVLDQCWWFPALCKAQHMVLLLSGSLVDCRKILFCHLQWQTQLG